MKVPLPQVEQRRVLADWVAATLQKAIRNDHFESGEKLDQDLIAEELGVSRTPVREAITKLQHEGLLEVLPHRGAFIAEISRRDIREVYESRRLLEPEVVLQVTPVIPESVLNELEERLDETPAQFDPGHSAEHFESDVYFHETLTSFVENNLLKEILDSLAKRITMARRLAESKPGPHLIKALNEHRAILQAIRDRDAERAADLMATHLENSCSRLQELL
jgi:DNA-binding GntR family transcriptional regulator